MPKLSVSLDPQLLHFLEGDQQQHKLKTKSDVIGEAPKLLRERELEGQYAAALREWQEDAPAWEAVAGDGLHEEKE